jgi:hypothetical protein
MGRARWTAGIGRLTRIVVPALLVAVALQAGATGPKSARAATPSSGTVSAATPTISWDFAPVGGPAGDTDSFAITVQLPNTAENFYAPDVRQGSTNAAVLQVTMTWTDTSPDQTLFLGATDAGNSSVGDDTLATTNDGSNINIFQLQDPTNQTYTLTASNAVCCSHAAIPAHAVANLQLIDLAGQAQPPNPAGAPGFSNYHIPLSLMPPRQEENTFGGRLFGEPSIGVDPRPGHDQVMYQAGLYTIRATFDDSTTPATPTFEDVSFPVSDTVSEDAILDVDRNTGRTFASQLLLACSAGSFSDNDGTSWTPSQTCQVPAGVDHQTIGAGAFHAIGGVPVNNPAYPDAVYYCSQNVAEAECALSLDGGVSYGQANVMWNSDQCFGLHGHVKVAPPSAPIADAGTVYVPNKACGHPECLIVTSTAGPNCHPGFAVSTDNGTTWTVHTINDQHSRLYDTGDPSIGVGANGTMYFGNNDRDGHPKIAVCTSQGTACGPSTDVGTAFHIENTEMPTVVAGDDNRAAFVFLGSTTPGDDQENAFIGTWDVYVAVTYDGGAHWTTTDATPNAPVQRGCIEFDGDCPSSRGSDDQRNLLDFNDLTIDREGRIVAAYTDGCQQDPTPAAGHGSCATDATRLSGLNPEIEGPAILRQNCGLTLYAAFDNLAVPCALTGVPEATWTGALILGGMGTIALSAIAARRRRRHRGSTSRAK